MRLHQKEGKIVALLFLILFLFAPHFAFAGVAVVLSGEACTDSEKWRIVDESLADDDQLHEILVNVPSSESSGLKKVTLLRASQKSLAAKAALTGAWNYWYYRATLAMKLPVYAESGFQNMVRSLPASNVFAGAAKSCAKRLQYSFKGIKPDSEYAKHESDDAAFFKTLEEPDSSRALRQYQRLYDSAKTNGDSGRADALAVAMSQDLYRLNQFKDASRIAGDVDKKGDHYAEALLVMAWSSFRLRDYQVAVGHAFSLLKAYPQSFEALEATWLAAAGFLEACLEKDGQKTLDYYKNQALKLDQWFHDHQADYAKDPLAFYYDQVKGTEMPFLIKSEWLKSARMRELQARLNSLADEQERLDGWLRDRSVTPLDDVQNHEGTLREYYKKLLGIEVKNKLTHAQATLNADIEKGQLLETDIISAIAQSSVRNQGPAAKDGANAVPPITKKVVWQRSGFTKGMADSKEELWRDDLGNFVGDFKNSCKH